jgi:hypothetical protein
VDVIKIDKSFTQAIGTESVIVAILPQILAMAEALELEVIAEGIETPFRPIISRLPRGPFSPRAGSLDAPSRLKNSMNC